MVGKIHQVWIFEKKDCMVHVVALYLDRGGENAAIYLQLAQFFHFWINFLGNNLNAYTNMILYFWAKKTNLK